ncbi:biotin--[acetyl-CoA-carboxylase] ligase [Nocardioides coralli]|uniref:biotin--[acetyl-CoA-carboxylase] ligase n=1 Tax=Nocardioides coralli TaxID=2872154 RepID=UPI001CA3CB26|nr:biotin--[acetyl-CoA-carboxylase] ligase [Nocardioides coralli]QZY29982.1 biotin--[acetyl-CoA-carboxylase] ligase [Nocardioides coralli]
MPPAADPRPPLDAARLAPLGVEVLPRAGSTNALVADRARAGEPEGLVLVTEHQTAGRGRLDRTWETPDRAALTFSLLLRPTRPAEEWPWLPLLAGVAVAAALRDHGVPAELKWPNDVLLDGDKTAGILAERLETGAGPAAVLGIGLNVTTTREELPTAAATSVLLATGGAPDRTELLATILTRLRGAYDAWSAGGSATLRAAYREACTTVGREVRVQMPGGDDLTGRVTDVDGAGRLVVAGTPVAAGDVVHVRPAG